MILKLVLSSPLLAPGAMSPMPACPFFLALLIVLLTSAMSTSGQVPCILFTFALTVKSVFWLNTGWESPVITLLILPFLGFFLRQAPKQSFLGQLLFSPPDFVEIYHQSEAAENAGLSRICGFGYRKALEFLIKDYAIYKNPGQEDVIKGEALAVCIKKYIKSEYLRDLATASALYMSVKR